MKLGEYSAAEQLAYEGLVAATKIAHRGAAKFRKNVRTGKRIKRNVGEMLMLAVSELGEGMEAHRKRLPDDKLPHRPGIEVEIADCIIRLLDTAKTLGLDVPGAVIEKMRFNRVRKDHKASERRKKHGKRY